MTAVESSPDDTIVIWNPQAGSKAGFSTNNDQSEAQLRAILDRAGLTYRLRATSSAAEATALAREARDAGIPLVVAAGGDGTVRAIARQLIGAEHTALGILPLGSVMNVARALDIPRDLDRAAAVIARRNVAAIDVALANGDPFLEAATVGLHAAVFEQGSRFDRGDMLALARAAWVAVRYRPSRMTIHLDTGVVRTSALAVFVANGPFAGLGFPVAPDARIEDGKLDVRVFERFSRLALLVHFWHIAAGRHGFEARVATYRSRTVRIEAASALPARADGERLGNTPVEFSIRPAALRVVRGEPGEADAPAGE